MADDTSQPATNQATDGFLESPIDWTVNQLGGTILGKTVNDLTNLPPDATLGQNEYDFSYRLYPLDLGNSGPNCHYVVFNINVSQFTNLASVSGPGGSAVPFTMTNELSKVDALRFNIDTQLRGTNGQQQGSAGLTGFPRLTRRIKESIGLFMPETAVYTQINEYTEFSLADVGQSVLESWAGPLSGPVARTIGAKVGDSIGALTSAGLKLVGLPINPRVEVIFKSTPQRRFQFEWLFAPSNEAESIALDQIIRTLRFHAAPEVVPFGLGNTGFGIFFIKPSEFDITFYHKGKENTTIPRINTCVLEQIDVDYAPTGRWATFQNGFPVAIKLQMTFREVEILHKLRVMQGF